MTVTYIVVVLLCLAAVFSYINERFIKMPTTIGVMLLAFILGLLSAFFVNYLGYDIAFLKLQDMVKTINFSEFVLQGILCFILFAGALTVSMRLLNQNKTAVASLALVGTILCTFIVATLTWLLFQIIGMPLSYIYCLIFGSIISSTDPIAALAILKSMGLPDKLEVIIDGESQFNDGVGVVLFVTFTTIAFGKGEASITHVMTMFLREVVGGVGLGLLMAGITHIMLQGVNKVISQILITLATVTLGYALAQTWHVSGPIASVVMGLVVGNFSLSKAVSETSQEHISLFWELINRVLEAILFVLIGLEVLLLKSPTWSTLAIAVCSILIVLIARYGSVLVTAIAIRLHKRKGFGSVIQLTNLFTWAGLHGALAIALVLSLPDNPTREILLIMTYAVVVFSILVQGSTIKYLFSRETLTRLAQR